MQALKPFKVALLDALRADSGVAALVGERVFDITPRDDRGDLADVGQGEPYLYLGPVTCVQEPTDCGAAWRTTARLYAVSFAADREQAWEIVGEAARALSDLQLIMSSGGHSPGLFVQQGGDVVDPILPVMAYLDVTTVIHA